MSGHAAAPPGVDYLHTVDRERDGFWSWLKSWLLTTDHKRIGVLYLVTVLSFRVFRSRLMIALNRLMERRT